jgi:hypothetical protein
MIKALLLVGETIAPVRVELVVEAPRRDLGIFDLREEHLPEPPSPNSVCSCRSLSHRSRSAAR